MSIKIRESTLVVPAEETPNTNIWLSDVDLTKRPPYTHTPMVYIYSNISNFLDATLLKESLSKVLVPFYPISGRYRENNYNGGRIEIECNANGVLFVEAETTLRLAYFGEFTSNAELRKLVIPTCDYSLGLASMPLFMVQLTRFSCGGVSLGFAVHHYAGDGSAWAYFNISWARIHRGLEIDVMPILDRTCVLVPRTPPQVKFHHPEFPFVGRDQLSDTQVVAEGTTVRKFKFSKAQVTELKLKAECQGMKYSTFEVLAAHIWRCACKARSVKHDQDVKLWVPVNGRPKLKAVPDGYFGNVVFNSNVTAKAGDVMSKPLSSLAAQVHEIITKVDQEYMLSAIDYLSLQPDVMALASGPHNSRCPDIHINFWSKMIPFFEADFGWGKPALVRHGGIGYEGQTLISMNPDGDDLFVDINLFTHHMDSFEKLIYDFLALEARL